MFSIVCVCVSVVFICFAIARFTFSQFFSSSLSLMTLSLSVSSQKTPKPTCMPQETINSPLSTSLQRLHKCIRIQLPLATVSTHKIQYIRTEFAVLGQFHKLQVNENLFLLLVFFPFSTGTPDRRANSIAHRTTRTMWIKYVRIFVFCFFFVPFRKQTAFRL